MRPVGRCAAIASLLAAVPALLPAQAPAGSATISPAAIAESLAVLSTLRASIANDPKNASLWYRQGMVAWVLSERARAKPTVAGLNGSQLSVMADTSLRIAAQLAPTNAYYRLAVGRFLFTSAAPFTKQASYGFFNAAVDLARADTNTYVHADAAVAAGHVYWLRYDSWANRRIATNPGIAVRSISSVLRPDMAAKEELDAAANEDFYGAGNDPGMGPTGASGALAAVREMLEQTTQPIGGTPPGDADYRQAEDLFREAYNANPLHPGTFRALATLLVERNRWVEAAALARAHVARAPTYAWAWMVLGLASHRQGDSKFAAAAFDSAMTYLSDADRARLTDLARVLRDTDARRVAQAAPGVRAATERLYWLTADPLWAREGNEARVEFLARVTFAELRWTVEELGVHGADSDRGDIYVRYGPPAEIAVIGADMQAQEFQLTTVWAYKSGLVFVFQGAPMYGTARLPREDMKISGGILDVTPVRWDNLSDIRVDSMPVQAVRFRAQADSVDVFLAVQPPATRIRNESAVHGSVRTDFWMLAGGTVPVRRDSVNLDSTATRSWTARVASGTYLYRVEASAEASPLAGRATAAVVAADDPATGFTLRGFSVSDVLLATGMSIPATPGRWSDVRFTPATGAVRSRGALALLWEVYEPTRNGDNASYTVTITLRRDRAAGERIAATLLGPLANVAGIDRNNDRVVIRFDRRVAYAPVIVDGIELGLNSTPPGRYTVTVEITDAASKRVAKRTSPLVILR